MRNWHKRAAVGAVVVGALVSTAAVALPWDTDMVDSQYVRAYECWIWSVVDGERTCTKTWGTLPEGVVSQDRIETPSPFKTPPIDKMDNEAWAALPNPLSPTPESLAKGEKMFRTYCTPCHGVPDSNGRIANLGTVAQPGRMAGVVGLSGKDGVLKARTDGQVYRAIRMGNAIMPAYNWAMTDDEMWSTVHYCRTLENSQYVPPPPPAPAPVTEGN
jgi:mono/diheme cytochrome c family protein